MATIMRVIDLIPYFGTKLGMISAKERGSGYVEEQAHGSADDRGVSVLLKKPGYIPSLNWPTRRHRVEIKRLERR
jgi:hypothetical protein